MHRSWVFLTLLVALAAIDSAAVMGFHEHPDVSPAALATRAVVCAIAGHQSARRRADAAVLPVLAFLAAFLSVAITDAVILASGVRLDTGFVGAGALVTRLVVPAAASAAGAVLALAFQAHRA
jgi:hypothetical protein